MKIFKTFKPDNDVLRNYISYYYIDFCDEESYVNEYICYPHYNNTISLYQNHDLNRLENHSIISFNSDAKPLQIFTPIRENILKITQLGKIFKIGIVFEPFGVNQFLEKLINFNKIVSSPSFVFFEYEFIQRLFNEDKFEKIIALLDGKLLSMLVQIKNDYLEKAIQIFHNTETEITIDELAETKLGISRKQLSRLFKKYIGTTPQKYRCIVRFRALMNHKINDKQKNNLTNLSLQAHYTDQSHFIKACKQLTGLTPSQFFKDGKIIGSEDTFWKFIN